MPALHTPTRQPIHLRSIPWITIIATLLLALAACNAPNESARSPDAEAEASTPLAPENSPDDPVPSESDTTLDTAESDEQIEPSVLAQTLVSEEGIGVAQLGMTLEDLKKALGPEITFSPQVPFIADFDAIAVRHGEENLFYILHLADSPLQDNDVIQGLLTDHPAFKTAEDVGVGTPLQAAEISYGKATLSYNTENESREYVRFDDHPATNISFGTQEKAIPQNGASSSGFAGIYQNPSSQYNETDVYQADAAIQAILIVCLSATCSQ